MKLFVEITVLSLHVLAVSFFSEVFAFPVTHT